MIATGVLLAALGLPLTILGIAEFASSCPEKQQQANECWNGVNGAIAFVPGLVGFAVGGPLLGVGIHRKLVWRAWQRAHGLTLRPHFGHGRSAWTTGLELRF